MTQGSDINEAFKNALQTYLSESPRGEAEDLAKRTGFAKSYISQLKSGIRYGDESTRMLVAEKCGYAYHDFLRLGGWKGKFSKKDNKTNLSKVISIRSRKRRKFDRDQRYREVIKKIDEYFEAKNDKVINWLRWSLVNLPVFREPPPLSEKKKEGKS